MDNLLWRTDQPKGYNQRTRLFLECLPQRHAASVLEDRHGLHVWIAPACFPATAHSDGFYHAKDDCTPFDTVEDAKEFIVFKIVDARVRGLITK